MKLKLNSVEVVRCGGLWKAWGYLINKLVESDDGHKTPSAALAQLRHRVRPHKVSMKDAAVRR